MFCTPHPLKHSLLLAVVLMFVQLKSTQTKLLHLFGHLCPSCCLSGTAPAGPKDCTVDADGNEEVSALNGDKVKSGGTHHTEGRRLALLLCDQQITSVAKCRDGQKTTEERMK